MAQPGTIGKGNVVKYPCPTPGGKTVLAQEDVERLLTHAEQQLRREVKGIVFCECGDWSVRVEGFGTAWLDVGFEVRVSGDDESQTYEVRLPLK